MESLCVHWPATQICCIGLPLNAVALQVLIVEDGTIKKFPGDFEDYRNQLIKEIAAELDEDE